MARVHITYEGTHLLDLTELEGDLVDLQAGSRQGMRTQLDGFKDARLELEQSEELNREAAGIPPDVFAHFLKCSDRLTRIDQKLVVAMKQVEVLTESRAYYVHGQQTDLGLMVDAMRSRAQRKQDRSCLVPFEETLRYHGQVGKKGALTKRRLAAEAADGGSRAPKAKAKAKGARGQAQAKGGAAKKPAPTAAKPGPAPGSGGELAGPAPGSGGELAGPAPGSGGK